MISQQFRLALLFRLPRPLGGGWGLTVDWWGGAGVGVGEGDGSDGWDGRVARGLKSMMGRGGSAVPLTGLPDPPSTPESGGGGALWGGTQEAKYVESWPNTRLQHGRAGADFIFQWIGTVEYIPC